MKNEHREKLARLEVLAKQVCNDMTNEVHCELLLLVGYAIGLCFKLHDDFLGIGQAVGKSGPGEAKGMGGSEPHV